MAAKSFKITFTLGDEDTAYFRKIYRSAKQHESLDGVGPYDRLDAAHRAVNDAQHTHQQYRLSGR